MQITKYSILVAIGKIVEKHGGNYSYASTKTMLGNLEKFTQIKIVKRTYYAHMRDLRKEGLIKSIRRYGRQPDGKIHNKTSAVCITIKGYVQLALRGWKWALSMAKKLRAIFVPKKTIQPYEVIPENVEAEKKETDAMDRISREIIKEGISLYDYLLNKGQRRMPLDNSIKPASN